MKKCKKRKRRGVERVYIRTKSVLFKLFVVLTKVVIIPTGLKETVKHPNLNVQRPFLPVQKEY